MEFLLGFVLIALGVLLIVSIVFGVSIALSVWESWWLFPFWATIVVPLGFPQIGFWHFTALNVFISALVHRHHIADHLATENKQVDSKAKRSAYITIYLSRIIGPIFGFYLLSWFLS